MHFGQGGPFLKEAVEEVAAQRASGLLQMSRRPEGFWRFQFKAFGQLDAATEDEMTLRMETCGDRYELTTQWQKIQNGYKLNLRDLPRRRLRLERRPDTAARIAA